VARSSISGLGVALATAGGLLVYTGIRNVALVDGLRDVIGGKPPGTTPGTPTGPAIAGLVTNVDTAITAHAAAADVSTATATTGPNSLGNAIADSARAYLGKPYVWAGNFAGSGGGDCSGLVYRALNDAGIKAPRLTALGYLGWSGATSVPRAQIATGDLVCWTGHIGIALGGDQMIDAPHTGAVVRIEKIWGNPPPVIRRVKG
jgi:cell wall-associated NlpC family hydrolase